MRKNPDERDELGEILNGIQCLLLVAFGIFLLVIAGFLLYSVVAGGGA